MKRLIYIPLLLLALTGYSQNVFRIPAPDTLPSGGRVFRISPSVVYLTGITISSSPTLCLGDTVYLTSRNATGYDSLQWHSIGEDDSPLTGTFLTGTTANTYYVPSATDLAGDMRFYLVGYSVVYQAADTTPTATWPELMLASYVSIQAPYGTYTQAEQDTILSIFSIQDLRDTFETKYEKEAADFIMIFFNSNKTTALTTRTWTKTGRTGIWRFGKNSYDRHVQTNLPADTCKNGWLAYTSVDGFSGLTRIFVQQNNFTGLFPLGSLPSTLTHLGVHQNAFTGRWTNWTIPSGLVELYTYTNTFTGDWVGKSFPSSFTLGWIYSSGFTGSAPGITPHATNSLTLRAYSNAFTNTDNLTAFRKAMTEFRLDLNFIITTEIGQLVNALNVYYTVNAPTVNCTIYLTGSNNGHLADGAANADLIALTTAYTNASKILTITYNTEP